MLCQFYFRVSTGRNLKTTLLASLSFSIGTNLKQSFVFGVHVLVFLIYLLLWEIWLPISDKQLSLIGIGSWWCSTGESVGLSLFLWGLVEQTADHPWLFVGIGSSSTTQQDLIHFTSRMGRNNEGWDSLLYMHGIGRLHCTFFFLHCWGRAVFSW